MKTISHHISRIHEKPHHVRKQVAFTAAFVGAAFIALVWLIGSIGSGVFALQDASFVEGGTAVSVGVEQGLAGVGALGTKPQDVPAHIKIIDASPSVPVQKRAEQTTIPF